MSVPLDIQESQAVDDRLALAGVLQELTVAALDLFDPMRSVDEFLQTLAGRMGCRVAVCLEVKEKRLALLGSAGLARASRGVQLPAITDAVDGEAIALPYPEVAAPSLGRWVIRPDARPESRWWLVLYFDREPQLARQYKGMLERLARQVGCAFEHRRLYERLLEREQNLRAASSRLQTLVAHLPSGIVAVGDGERVTHVNDAFCQLVGLPSEALLGADADHALHTIKLAFRDPDGFIERTSETRARGDVSIGEEDELKDGRIVERDFVPILVDGVPVGRVWTFRDVTRAHRAADEIRLLNEGLEQRVAERTRELEATNAELASSLQTLGRTQQRLAVSDRMASIGTLAAGIAHEINNPLAYIIANQEMILEEIQQMGSTPPLQEIAKMAQEALEGAERVRRIVRSLKTFSRSDEEQRVSVDLHRVLEQSIRMAFNEIRHRARIEKDLGPVPMVEGDETRLGQVFVNLLVNAAQAIPAGDAQSHAIRIVTRTDHAHRAVVEVHDTGPGIPPEILDHIFDPFFTTKAVGVGTGLGLSICHGIIATLGGEITAESGPGHTLFRVTLGPAAFAEHTAVRTCIQLAPLEERASVLVIDDEPMVRAAVQRVLKRHDVVVVASGASALAQLRARQDFHVILCDLMMPEMTGMELHAEIMRVAPKLVDRMVFMSGGAFTAPAAAFLERVVNERVEKPFEPKDLRALVVRLRAAVERGAATAA